MMQSLITGPFSFTESMITANVYLDNFGTLCTTSVARSRTTHHPSLRSIPSPFASKSAQLSEHKIRGQMVWSWRPCQMATKFPWYHSGLFLLCLWWDCQSLWNCRVVDIISAWKWLSVIGTSKVINRTPNQYCKTFLITSPASTT